jgi:superfamily I DNA and/or RNA helicase
MRTIELWIASGDLQHHPPKLSPDNNEMYPEVQDSLLTTWTEDVTLDVCCSLTLQHRMRPIHSELLSRIWPNNTADDDVAVLDKPPIEYTLEDAHRGLGYRWNQRMRLAIDVSGPDTHSEHPNPNARGSLINVAEADLIVDYIKYLLGFQHDVNGKGRRIRLDDFLVIAPYYDQAATIRRKLLLAGVTESSDSDEKDTRIKVLTSETVHGHEANIVLFSLTRNIPGQPFNTGFIRQKEQLRVNFSRVKVLMVTFGNLMEQVKGVCDAHRDFEKG